MKIKKVVTGLVLCAMMAASIAMPSRAASNSTSKLYNGSPVSMTWHLNSTQASASARVNLPAVIPSIRVDVYNSMDYATDGGYGVYDVIVYPITPPSWASYTFYLNNSYFYYAELYL